ncbi:MAG: glycosyltransferase, partial [Acidobacteria bacterium]|nr:glycosyltransferase [Acidobacteriota bacterium]
AMAAGVPVVALDAPGVRDVVEDGVNGRLLATEEASALATGLSWLAELPAQRRETLQEGARATARELSIGHTAARTRDLYRRLIQAGRSSWVGGAVLEDSPWHRARRRLAEEWKIVRNLAHALGDLLSEEEE